MDDFASNSHNSILLKDRQEPVQYLCILICFKLTNSISSMCMGFWHIIQNYIIYIARKQASLKKFAKFRCKAIDILTL